MLDTFCIVILHKVSITQYHGLCKVCSISFELKWLKSTQLLFINFLLGIYWCCMLFKSSLFLWIWSDSPNFFNRVFCGVAKSVFVTLLLVTDDSSILLSPLLPLLIPGNNLSNSCFSYRQLLTIIHHRFCNVSQNLWMTALFLCGIFSISIFSILCFLYWLLTWLCYVLLLIISKQ